MSAFKSQHRHLTIGGRSFHFVSYEGVPANPKRDIAATPPMWYAMVGGRRWPVSPCDPNLTTDQVDAALLLWAEENAVSPPGATATATPPRSVPRNKGNENWWGTN